jgi:hypothetical protein
MSYKVLASLGAAKGENNLGYQEIQRDKSVHKRSYLLMGVQQLQSMRMCTSTDCSVHSPLSSQVRDVMKASPVLKSG